MLTLGLLCFTIENISIPIPAKDKNKPANYLANSLLKLVWILKMYQ